MSTGVGYFLKGYLGRPEPWNCSTLVADWLVACGYPDFAGRFRHVTDDAECERVPAGYGGLAIMWESLFLGRLPRADEPWIAGDVAVVRLRAFEAGAIFTGERWALRSPRGLHFAAVDQVDVAEAWRPQMRDEGAGRW